MKKQILDAAVNLLRPFAPDLTGERLILALNKKVSEPKLERPLTREEAAKFLSVSRRTIDRYIIDGKIKGKKIGSRVLVDTESLRSFTTPSAADVAEDAPDKNVMMEHETDARSVPKKMPSRNDRKDEGVTMNAGNAMNAEKAGCARKSFMPGPWRIVWNKKERMFLIGWQDSSYRIAEADDPCNAHLIAAAPKMYEMLVSVLDECDACGDTDPVDCPLKMQIEAVLKEARGEPDLCAELKNCADALEEIIGGVIGGDLPDTVIACAQDDLDRARAVLKKAQGAK